MTEFKVGDRVRYTDAFNGMDPKLIGAEGTVREQLGHTNVRVDWDGGRSPRGVFPGNIEKIETPKLAFVGPEPEPAELPAVTTPFQTSKVDPNLIQDSRGLVVAEFSGQDTDIDQDHELAALVVRLLNEHFGVK